MRYKAGKFLGGTAEFEPSILDFTWPPKEERLDFEFRKWVACQKLNFETFPDLISLNVLLVKSFQSSSRYFRNCCGNGLWRIEVVRTGGKVVQWRIIQCQNGKYVLRNSLYLVDIKDVFFENFF